MLYMFKQIDFRMIVNTFNEIISAIQNDEKQIEISRSILCNYPIFLPPNVHIYGKKQEDGEYPLLSFQFSDGIGISYNNSIKNLNIDAPVDCKAIFNTLVKDNLGDFVFDNLFIKGQLSFIARAGVEKASITINNVDIYAADTRHYLEQPQKYGVNVLQGALTIYNINPSKTSIINLSITNLSIGRKNAPVSGSGIFISGFGDEGGEILIAKLHTQAVYSNGKIPLGVSDYITAGVFVLYGAHAQEVITNGEITTYGVNDMVLDVWGSVDNWISNAAITSYGPSGVGFVNFGYVKNFSVNAPLKTYGLGARGYNQYDGTVENITFESIETFGNGSVGIQISKKIGQLTVEKDITTHGSIGSSLVKGVYIDLPAYALSIKNGGEAKSITIKGNIVTHGDHVISYVVENGGNQGVLNLEGEIVAKGKESIKKKINF
jgi:hypothetical protein